MTSTRLPMPTQTPLTNEQIDALFKFVKSKYVDYYDVQLELVDHLASEVEQKMATNPAVSFETALQQVYSGFGIFGFSDLVEQKQKAVNKRSRLLWWEYVKRLFRLPLLLGSLTGGLLLFTGFNFLGPLSFININAVVSLLAIIGFVLHYFKNQPNKSHKLIALEHSGGLYAWGIVHFHPVYFFSKMIVDLSPPEVYPFLVPLLCWLSWVACTASAMGYKKLVKETQKLYPMAFA